MNPTCQSCNQEFPEDFLLDMSIVNGDTQEVEIQTICQNCAAKFDKNTDKLWHKPVYSPIRLTSTKYIQMDMSCA